LGISQKVYGTKPHNLKDLRNRIVHETSLMILEQTSNVINNFCNNEYLTLCQTVEERHFEYLIN